MDSLLPTQPQPPPEPPKKERRDPEAMRMVRVGKWTKKPSKDAVAHVTKFLTKYFQTEKVWHRKEHGAYVVAVLESPENTALVEEFRFNRTMEQRFRFHEARGKVEVELRPL